MVLATAKVEDFDRFWSVFSTKGAEKRKQHGSKGANVFQDPNDPDRYWVVFDWDEEGCRWYPSQTPSGHASQPQVPTASLVDPNPNHRPNKFGRKRLSAFLRSNLYVIRSDKTYAKQHVRRNERRMKKR